MDCFCNNNSATTLPHKTSNTTPEMRFDKNMFPLNVEHLQNQLIHKICYNVSLPNIKLDHPTASKSN